MGGVGGKRDGGDTAENLGLFLDFHVGGVDLGEGSVSGAEEKVSVVKEVDLVDSLREKSLGWADALVDVVSKRDLYNITGLGAKVGEGVGGVDNTTGKDSLDLVHEDLVVANLLLHEVEVPGSDSEVVDGHALGVGAVVESNFVRYVHSNGVANEGLAALDLHSINTRFKI